MFTEAIHPCAPIVSEQHGFRSRDNLTIAPSQTVVVGQVLGKAGVVSGESATVTPNAGNTGNGVLTMDGTAPIRGDAIDGEYQVEMIGAGATAPFNVLDPTGELVGEGKVGTTFAGPIKFAIAAGGVAFAAGDQIAIQIARPVGNDIWSPVNSAATDGTEYAAGVAMYPIVTPSSGGPNQITGITRDAELRAADLSWPNGASAAQIAEWTNQLLKRGIVLR